MRRHGLRTALSAALTIAVLALAATILFTGWSSPRIRPYAYGGTQTRQTTTALLDQCGPTYDFPHHTAQPSGVIPDIADNQPVYLRYDTIVPVFGAFYITATRIPPSHFWALHDPHAPASEQLLHSMWNGWLVVYYTSDASRQEIAQLRIDARNARLRMLVAPWPVRRGPLPNNRHFALAVWNASQTCIDYSTALVREFRAAHPVAQAPGPSGQIPRHLRLIMADGKPPTSTRDH